MTRTFHKSRYAILGQFKSQMPVLHCNEVSQPNAELGHLLPRHLAGRATA